MGRVIGTGPGRGFGLTFIALGTVMTLAALIAYSVPNIRQLDDLSEDFSCIATATKAMSVSQAEIAHDKERLYALSQETQS